MIVRLINFIVFAVIACLVAIQIDEYNVPLIVGHKGLLAVVIISSLMAFINFASAIRSTALFDDLDPIDY